ncbi:MAG: hypothetical protein AB7G75_26155 [Candidatus Binatia bacterium]
MNNPVLGLFHDEGLYVTLAKSLSEGQGLRLLNLPTAPVQTKYPILYPYLLSWAWWLNPAFPDNAFLLKSINGVFFFAVLVITSLWIYRCFNENKNAALIAAALAVALVGSNPAIFSIVNRPLSETLFLMFVLLALLGFDQKEDARFSFVHVAFLGIVAALAYLTRTVGAAVIGAGGLHLLVRHRWRLLVIYSLTVALFFVPWTYWQQLHRPDHIESQILLYYVSYNYQPPAFILIWSDWSRAWLIVWGNLRYTFDSFASLFLLNALPILKYWVYPLLGIGAVVSLRKQTVFLWSFLLLYGFLILTWSWHPARLMVPLIPLLVLFLLRGAYAMQTFLQTHIQVPWVQNRVGFWVMLPFAALLTLNGMWLSLYVSESPENSLRLWFGKQALYSWQGFEETFAWIREHTKEKDILASAYDPLYYLHTGRQAIRPWFYKPETYFYPYGKAVADVGSAQEVKRELVALGVDYLVIDPIDSLTAEEAVSQLFAELLRSYEGQAREVFVSADGFHKVYALP